MTTDRSRIAAMLAGAALVFAACGSSSPSADSSSPTDTGSSDTEVSDSAVAEGLSESTCAIATDDGLFDEVDCAQPHDSELAGLVAPPDASVPADEDEQRLQLGDVCASPIYDLVGQPGVPLSVQLRFVAATTGGAAYAGDVECWIHIPLEGALSASIADVGLSSAIGDFVFFEELDPGTCISQPSADANGIGVTDDCTGDDAEVLFGVVFAADGPFPGEGALLEEGVALCAVEIEDAFEGVINLEDSFVAYPDELGWTLFGQRTMLCTVPISALDLGDAAAGDSGSDEVDPQLVELLPPEGFVFGDGEPICALDAQEFSDEFAWAEASCGSLHDAELVAVVGPPDGTIPADATEASVFFLEICRTSVEDATGADLTRSGVGIGFNAPGVLGGEYEGPVACYASSSSVALVGSFQDGPLEQLLGDQVVIADLAPGECFVFAEDSFGIGSVAGCDEPDALMFVGSYEAADRPYPGQDELRAERDERCPAVLAESGLVESGVAGDPSTLSGTFPDELPWEVPGRRLVTCDIAPA